MEPNTYGLTLDMFYDKTYLKKCKNKSLVDDLKKQLKYNGDHELKAIMAKKNRKSESSLGWAYPGSQSGK